METKKLGNSDLHLTPIGFGAWAIGGGDWAFAWGPQDDADSIQAIHRALDLGINWIDTAAVYGLGHSEEVVGKALKTTSAKPYVFTKCSMLWDDKREIHRSLKTVRQELEASLRRLQLDVIDLYQIHWPMPEDEIEQGWSTMADLQREGKIRWIGVSNFSVAQMERIQAIAPITSLQPPYSMVNRSVEAEILPFCEKQRNRRHQLLAHGLRPPHRCHDQRTSSLPSPKTTSAATPNSFRSRNSPAIWPWPTFWDSIGVRHGVSAGVVAIAWTLHNKAITAAIVGGRSAKQVDGIFPAATFRLTESEVAEIGAFLKANP